MTYALLVLAAALFLLCLKHTGVVTCVLRAMGEARRAVAVIGARDMTDDEKEVATRAAAIGMFGAFLSILARSLIALGLPALLIAGAVAGDVVAAPELEAAVTNGYVLVGGAVAMFIFWRALR